MLKMLRNSVKDTEKDCRGGSLMRNNGRHCHVLGARHGGDRADKEERYPKSAVISSGVRGALSRPPNISDFIKNVGRDSPE